jgi:hypothetical protein
MRFSSLPSRRINANRFFICEDFVLGSAAMPVLTGLELNSVWSDYFKHLTTLSTGAVVLIATFLEKFAPHPHWRPAVIVSLLGFLVAILGSIAVMTGLAMNAPNANTAGGTGDWVDVMQVLGMFAAWLGFVIGITALTIFALKNLPV